MHSRNALWIALVALWLAGCGNGGDDAPVPGAPSAGTVHLVSEKRLDPVWYGPNKISNGSFQEWDFDQDTPTGFSPPEADFSQIAEAAGGVRQSWSASDQLPASGNLFRTHASLRGGVPYRLTVLAETKGGGLATMSLWRAPEGGVPELLDPSLLTLLPGQGLMKKYTRTVQVPEDGSYELASSAVLEPEASFEVTWYRWQLTPIGEAME